MRRQRIKMIGLFLLAMAAAMDAASAQTDYPNNPVRLISDSGPGSAVDTGLRIVADGMSRYWKQQVVIVNQPGAAVKVTLEIQAELPQGASESTQRTVTENCTALRFDSGGFESE